MSADPTVEPHPYLSEEYIRQRYDETLLAADREFAPIVGVPRIPLVSTWQKWYRARLLYTTSFPIKTLMGEDRGSRRIIPKGMAGWATETSARSWTIFLDINPWPYAGHQSGRLNVAASHLDFDLDSERSIRCFPSSATDLWLAQDRMTDHVVGEGVLPAWPPA